MDRQSHGEGRTVSKVIQLVKWLRSPGCRVACLVPVLCSIHVTTVFPRTCCFPITAV